MYGSRQGKSPPVAAQPHCLRTGRQHFVAGPVVYGQRQKISKPRHSGRQTRSPQTNQRYSKRTSLIPLCLPLISIAVNGAGVAVNGVRVVLEDYLFIDENHHGNDDVLGSDSRDLFSTIPMVTSSDDHFHKIDLGTQDHR